VLQPAKLSRRKGGRLSRLRNKIIAREQLKKAEEAKEAVRPAAAEAPEPRAPDSRTLTTTQWLSVISIIISVVGVYYKREEIKKVFAKPKKVSTPPPPPEVVKTPKKEASSPWIKFFN